MNSVTPWIKSLSPFDPVLKPILDSFGFDGYGRFVIVLEYCRGWGPPEIDEKIICRLTGCNSRGASKFLPLFKETLIKIWGNKEYGYGA